MLLKLLTYVKKNSSYRDNQYNRNLFVKTFIFKTS